MCAASDVMSLPFVSILPLLGHFVSSKVWLHKNHLGSLLRYRFLGPTLQGAAQKAQGEVK